MTPALDPTLPPDPSPAGRGEDIKPDEPPDEPSVIPVNCERCYSTDIHRIPKVRIFLAGTGILLTYGLMSGREGTLILFLAILSLALVLLFLDRWRCRECGHTWSGDV